MARKTDTHHYAMETVKVDDSRIGRMSEDGIESDAANDNTSPQGKLEDDAAVTDMLVEGRLTCEVRDVISFDDTGDRKRQERPLHWVPYIHFGI